MSNAEIITFISNQLIRMQNSLDDLNKSVSSQETKIESIREKISVIDENLTELKKKSEKWKNLIKTLTMNRLFV